MNAFDKAHQALADGQTVELTMAGRECFTMILDGTPGEWGGVGPGEASALFNAFGVSAEYEKGELVWTLSREHRGAELGAVSSLFTAAQNARTALHYMTQWVAEDADNRMSLVDGLLKHGVEGVGSDLRKAIEGLTKRLYAKPEGNNDTLVMLHPLFELQELLISLSYIWGHAVAMRDDRPADFIDEDWDTSRLVEELDKLIDRVGELCRAAEKQNEL